MSVPSVNLPCRYLTENPQIQFRALSRSASFYNILEKISWVAFTAIMATVFSVYYTGTVLTGIAPLLMGAMILSVIPIIIALPRFRVASDHYAKLAKDEERIVLELKNTENWGEPEIAQFLTDKGLVPERVSEPLPRLLPLIARFNTMKQEAAQIEQVAQQSLAARYENVRDEDSRDTLFYRSQFLGTHEHESRAIPAALNAAAMLRMVQNPRHDIALQSQTDYANLEIPGLGKCKPKPFGMRRFDDNYFFFDPRLNREPLTLTEIEQDMTPEALYWKLFPNAERV